MSQNSIPFHLSKPNTSSSLSSFDWLMCYLVDGTFVSDLRDKIQIERTCQMVRSHIDCKYFKGLLSGNSGVFMLTQHLNGK
jgi:hypothetical protein